MPHDAFIVINTLHWDCLVDLGVYIWCLGMIWNPLLSMYFVFHPNSDINCIFHFGILADIDVQSFFVVVCIKSKTLKNSPSTSHEFLLACKWVINIIEIHIFTFSGSQHEKVYFSCLFWKSFGRDVCTWKNIFKLFQNY